MQMILYLGKGGLQEQENCSDINFAEVECS